MSIGQLRSLHRYPVKSMGGESLSSVQVAQDGLLGDRAYALCDDEVGEIRSARRWPGLLQCSARYREQPTLTYVPAAAIRMPDGTETSTDHPAISSQLSAYLGLPARLYPRMPASDKQHYRRANTGATAAGLLVRSPALRRIVDRLAKVGAGAEMRMEFGREEGEPLPDLSVFQAEFFEFVSPPGSYFDAYPIHLITSASLDWLRARQPAGDWDPRRFRPNLLIETGPGLAGLVESGWSGRTLRVGELELECLAPTPRCNMVMQSQPELRKDPSILRTIVRDAAQNLGIYARVKRPGRVAVGDTVELD